MCFIFIDHLLHIAEIVYSLIAADMLPTGEWSNAVDDSLLQLGPLERA